MVARTGQSDPAYFVKSANDLAVRVEVDDLRGLFQRRLIVRPGTQAILLLDGRNAGVVGPGAYTLQTLPEQLKSIVQPRQATAVLVDTSPCDLEFVVNNLYTNDPIEIALDCTVTLQVAQPTLLLTQLMKGRDAFSLNDLRLYLFDEVRDAAQLAVGTFSIYDLGRDLTLGPRIRQDIAMRLADTLERNGLELVDVRVVHFRHQEWDAVRKENAAYFLQVSRSEADLEGRKRLLDVKSEADLLDLAEQTRRVEHYERRAILWRRAQRAVQSHQIDEAATEEELAQFLDRIDSQKLVRRREKETLVREYAAQEQDRRRARAHLLARIELEQEHERHMLALGQENEYSAAQLDAIQARERAQLVHQLDQRRRKWEIELVEQQAREEAERSQRQQNERDRRAGALADAQTGAQIAEIERAQDRADAALGIELLQEMKQMKLTIQAERDRIELRRKRGEQTLALEARLAEHEMALERARQEHQIMMAEQAQEHEFELRKLEKMGQLSAEALVALAGAEQGRIIAELQRTRVMAGKNADEILAMAADRSPDVALAFQEKFRALAQADTVHKADMERLYGEMLARQDTQTDAERQNWRQIMQMMQAMFDKALDSQRETAAAFAGEQAVEEAPPVVCPACGETSPAGAVGCMHCGRAL